MIKAVIFDMGGVLLRTEDLTPRARLAAQLGVTLRELEHLVFSSESSMKKHIGLGSVLIWDFLPQPASNFKINSGQVTAWTPI